MMLHILNGPFIRFKRWQLCVAFKLVSFLFIDRLRFAFILLYLAP